MEKHQLKILSIDGGGIKGIIPCIILREIEKRTGRKIFELFDVVAGTSTGGILGLGITKPNAYPAANMLDMYKDEGAKIFAGRKRNFLSRIGSVFGSTGSTATQNTYKIEGLEEILLEKFGDATLAEAQTNVVITSYDADKGLPFYFSSRLAKTNKDENFELREVARSTSAAPTYFEPNVLKHETHKDMVLVDGGVFANNPAILAYAEAKEIWKQKTQLILPSPPDQTAKGYVAVVTPDDLDLPFYMLSLGCGYAPTTVKAKDSANWNAFKWFEPLMADIFMRSVAQSIHYSMQHLMPPYTDASKRYQRIDMQIPDSCREMDNASKENIKNLIATAEKYVADNSKMIDEICNIVG